MNRFASTWRAVTPEGDSSGAATGTARRSGCCIGLARCRCGARRPGAWPARTVCRTVGRHVRSRTSIVNACAGRGWLTCCVVGRALEELHRLAAPAGEVAGQLLEHGGRALAAAVSQRVGDVAPLAERPTRWSADEVPGNTRTPSRSRDVRHDPLVAGLDEPVVVQPAMSSSTSCTSRLMTFSSARSGSPCARVADADRRPEAGRREVVHGADPQISIERDAERIDEQQLRQRAGLDLVVFASARPRRASTPPSGSSGASDRNGAAHPGRRRPRRRTRVERHARLRPADTAARSRAARTRRPWCSAARDRGLDHRPLDSADRWRPWR